MKILSYIFYILSLPAFLLSPIPLLAFEKTSPPQEIESNWNVPRDANGNVNPWVLFHEENLSIDRYFDFIELASNQQFLETLSEEEFDTVVDFITTMLRASAPESLEEVVEEYEQDIEEILDDLYGEEKWELAYSNGFNFEFAPAAIYANSFPKVFLCKKNWLQRKTHHFGHWCSKHKKPLIIGAVVIAAVAIAVTTGGIGGSSAVAVGGALINDAYNEEDTPEHINKPGEVYTDNKNLENQPTYYHPDTPHHLDTEVASENNPTLIEQSHALSFEKVEEAKLEITDQTEDILESAEKSYIEKTKDITKAVASNIVHDVFEGVSKIGNTYHQINPISTPEDLQAYKEFVATQHEKIDEIFGTHYPDYSLESKEYAEAYKAAIIEELGHCPEMQIGELPPPGTLINIASRAATVASRTIGLVATSGSTVGSAAAISSMIKWEAPIPVTQANDTCGWRVGDPINNRTINENVPTWSAVRHRYWRNEALNVKNGLITEALELECYEPTVENIARMEKGLAPQTFNSDSGKMESIELHHEPPQRDGGLFNFKPMTSKMHEKIDSYRHTGN